MKKYLAVLSALAFLGSAGVAMAADARGVLTDVNEQERSIQLDDGTIYQLGDGISVEGLEPGQEVTVSFDEQGDQKVVKDIVPMGAGSAGGGAAR